MLRLFNQAEPGKDRHLPETGRLASPRRRALQLLRHKLRHLRVRRRQHQHHVDQLFLYKITGPLTVEYATAAVKVVTPEGIVPHTQVPHHRGRKTGRLVRWDSRASNNESSRRNNNHRQGHRTRIYRGRHISNRQCDGHGGSRKEVVTLEKEENTPDNNGKEKPVELKEEITVQFEQEERAVADGPARDWTSLRRSLSWTKYRPNTSLPNTFLISLIYWPNRWRTRNAR